MKQKCLANPALLKIVILSISLVVMSANPISVLMGDIEASYPDVDRVTLQNFVTICAVTTMVFILVSGVLSGVVGVRKVLLSGFVIYTIGGLSPMVLQSFTLLLMSRMLLGIGIGLVYPLAVSLIADFFTGKERTALLGYQFSVGNIGLSAMLLLAGFLSAYGWRTSFIVYSIGIPVFFFVYFLLPEPPVSENAALSGRDRRRLNKDVIIIALMVGTYNMTYMTVFSGLALVVKESGFGDAAAVGVSMTMMTALSMFTAASYGRVFGKVGMRLGGLAMTSIAFSFMILWWAPNMTAVTVGLLFLGAGNSVFMPFGNMLISNRAPVGSTTFCLSIQMACCNLGTFLSPFVFGAVGRAVGAASGRTIFFVASLLLFSGAAGLLIVFRKRGGGDRPQAGIECLEPAPECACE